MAEKKPHVWVIEVKFAGTKQWNPTKGAQVTQKEAIRERRRWVERFIPEDKFRIRKYVRMEE